MPSSRDTSTLVCLAALLAAAAGSARAEEARTLGRAPQTGATAPPRPICEAARDARARNSPAAPNLEAQCSAQGGGPAKTLGRVPVTGKTLGRVPPAGPEPQPVVEAGGGRRPELDPSRGVAQLQRVPNVVGMMNYDAAGVLRAAGYEPRETQLDEPDPSVAYGHVKASVPAAGERQAGGEVEIQIPRAASEVGFGALAIADVGRRDGFDLDTFRYEQVGRGADIVLRQRAGRPVVEPSDGHTYYAGNGIYIEPSDGATITLMTDNPVGEVGSSAMYFACERALRARPVELEVEQRLFQFGIVTGCVRTTRGQTAAIQFLKADNPGGVSDHKFHIALFPRQFGLGSDRAVVQDGVRR